MKKIGQITGTALRAIPRGKQLKVSKRELTKKGEAILKHAETSKKFLTMFNPDFCRTRYLEFKSAKEALTSNVIKVRELADCYGDDIIQLWIVAWLINLSSHMDFEISENQADETALFLIEELYMLNIAELTLFFKRLKKGHYGIFYNKYNPQIILRAAKEYRKERGKIISNMTTEEQQKISINLKN